MGMNVHIMANKEVPQSKRHSLVKPRATVDRGRTGGNAKALEGIMGEYEMLLHGLLPKLSNDDRKRVIEKVGPVMDARLTKQLQALNDKKTEAGINVPQEIQSVPTIQVPARSRQNDTNQSSPGAETPSSSSASEGFLGVGSDISFLRFPDDITVSDH
jgi:hypothetical protein